MADADSAAIHHFLKRVKSLDPKVPRLEDACALWYHFSLIWDAPDPASGKSQARKWRKTLGEFEPDLLELVELMGWDEDELYTEHNFSLETTDYLKAIKADLQKISEAGRGYDFEVFRGKALYCNETLVRSIVQPEERVFGLILEEPTINIVRRSTICGASIEGLIESIERGYF